VSPCRRVAVSSWRLARAVSLRGQLGVVSGTGIDTVVARRLQLGDPGGHLRRAFDAFPLPEAAERVWDRYFIPGGKPAGAPFKSKPIPTIKMPSALLDLLVISNFSEVFLAKAGQAGRIGINLLEKVQLPNLAALLGAMLAKVDVVLMGAGIPRDRFLIDACPDAGAQEYGPGGRIRRGGGECGWPQCAAAGSADAQ
jgi:nitronate monooxygenase